MADCYELIWGFRVLLPHCTKGAQDFRDDRRCSDAVSDGFLRPKREIVQRAQMPRRIPCDINAKHLFFILMCIVQLADQLLKVLQIFRLVVVLPTVHVEQRQPRQFLDPLTPSRAECELFIANEFVKCVGEFAAVDKLSAISEANYEHFPGIRSGRVDWVRLAARAYGAWGTFVLRIKCRQVKTVHERGECKVENYNGKQAIWPILADRSRT